MVNLLTNVGEEWYTDNNIDGATVIVGLYSDSSDALGEGDNLAAISSEPTGSNYSRQNDTVTSTQIGSNYGIDSDGLITFDTSDSSVTVDAAFIVVNFQSSVAGDGSATDNLVAAGDLSQSRDLSQIDTVEIAAGDLEITID